MPSKTIGIFGNFGHGNIGNDGSLESIIIFIRERLPESQLLCICTEPDEIKHKMGIKTLPTYSSRGMNRNISSKLAGRIRDHVRLFKYIRDFDVLLIPGTGILDDFRERPRGMPYTIFLICLIARLNRIRIAFVSIGAGPITHPLSRWLMKSAARMATYRSYRDHISKDYMQRIGIDVTSDPIYPDLAFRLPDPKPIERNETNAMTVGLGVMDYVGPSPDGDQEIYNLYINRLTEFALWLLNKGYRIRLLIGQSSDQCAIDDLLDRLQTATGGREFADSITADVPDSLQDLMAQMSHVDVVVATRFHNILCALKIGKPTISISYATKNDVLMTAMGQGKFCQHIDSLDINILVEQFERLVQHRKYHEDIIKNNRAHLRDQLESQERFLLNNLM